MSHAATTTRDAEARPGRAHRRRHRNRLWRTAAHVAPRESGARASSHAITLASLWRFSATTSWRRPISSERICSELPRTGRKSSTIRCFRTTNPTAGGDGAIRPRTHRRRVSVCQTLADDGFCFSPSASCNRRQSIMALALRGRSSTNSTCLGDLYIRFKRSNSISISLGL